jgi:trans-aconitate 2-methyltransferase
VSRDTWNPGQYEKFKSERSRPFHDLVSLVQPSGVRTIVDLGCGTGELTKHLHEKIGAERTLGTDSSAQMLAKATSFAGSGLTFERTPIEEFAPMVPFDLVFTNAALQWLPNHRELIPRVLKWVAPHGQIAIQVPANFDHPSHTVAHALGDEMFPGRLTGMAKARSVLDVAEYATMLFREGFEENRCRMEVYLHPMASGREVVEWTKGTMLTSFQSQLKPEEFTAFVGEYTKRLVAVIGEGPYVYAFKRILIWGRRS